MTNIDGPQISRSQTYVDPGTADPVTPTVRQAAVVDDPRADRIAIVQQRPMPASTQVHAVAPVGATETASRRRFAPDAVIAALVGLVLLVVGLLAVVRGGFDGPMEEPVVQVLGFTHTTTLGLIEVGLGLCLLICGAASSRSGAMFFGAVMGIGGFVGAVQTESFRESLALESGLAWLSVVAAVVVVLSALLMPRIVTNSNTVHPVY